MARYYVRTKKGWWGAPGKGTTNAIEWAHPYDAANPDDVVHIVMNTMGEGDVAGRHRIDGDDPIRLREVKNG